MYKHESGLHEYYLVSGDTGFDSMGLKPGSNEDESVGSFAVTRPCLAVLNVFLTLINVFYLS